MYLHLGADCMIKNTDIIAIFNIRDQQSGISALTLKRRAEEDFGSDAIYKSF